MGTATVTLSDEPAPASTPDEPVVEEDAFAAGARDRRSPWSRWDALGLIWVVAAGIATVFPALSHGASLGPYQELSKFGVLQHPTALPKGQFLFGQDPLVLSIAWKALSWTQVHSGHLPLWNPYNTLGMPLAFNLESAPFSLQALIGYLAPLRLAFTISILTSLVIGGTGAYVLCRVLRVGVLGAAMAGVVYELSGPFMSLLSWQDTAVLCWAGWLFAVTVLIFRGHHRVRHVVAFALIVALAGYAGQPEALFFLLLSLGIFVAVVLGLKALRAKRLSVSSLLRPLGDLVIAGIAGLALFAPSALPALQLSSKSVRAKFEPLDNVSTAQARLQSVTHGKILGHALSLHDLTHLLFQRFDGLPVVGGTYFADRSIYIDSVAYVGVAVVVLAVVAVAIRRRRPVVVAIAAMTGCMFALAFVQPVVVVADHLPIVGTFLWNRALIPMAFGIAVLAGIGIDVVVREHHHRRVQQWFGWGFVAISAVLAALWLFGSGHLPAAEAAVRAHSFVWPATTAGIGLVLAAVLWSGHPSASARMRHRSDYAGPESPRHFSSSRRPFSYRQAPPYGHRARSSCRRRRPPLRSEAPSVPRSSGSATRIASFPRGSASGQTSMRPTASTSSPCTIR